MFQLVEKLFVDINPVYVSTEGKGTNDNENFQLTTADDSSLLHGVLCENGWYLLNCYQRPIRDLFRFCFYILY